MNPPQINDRERQSREQRTTRMRTQTTLTLTRGVMLFGLFLAAACGRVVGAECIDGHELCGEICCPTVLCTNDVCLDGDGGSPDADLGRIDGGETDAATDGSLPRLDGFVSDMGDPECDIGTSQCGDECVNVDFDEDNCGACGVECDPGELCAFGVCEETCEPPLIDCGGSCVDPSSDPQNCGGCGNVCASAICRPAGCLEASASDVMLVGHAFAESSIAAATLAGNGALLRLEEPVRIAVYEGSASTSNQDRILDAIDTIADEAGRTYEIVPSSALQVPTRLQRADTFLVMPQEEATDDELRALGNIWRTALGSFVARGGAILVFDGSGDHSGTWQILTAASLLDVAGRVDVDPDVVCETVTPTDALANEVPVSYSAPEGTVAFTGVSEGEVVTAPVDGGELPVAIHRFVGL